MRGMKKAINGVVLAGTVFGVSSAFAAAGVTRTDVVPISDPVTYSILAGQPGGPQTFYIGYEIRTQNTSANTINHIVVEGTINVSDSLKSAILRPALTVGATCDFAPYPTNAQPIGEGPIAGALSMRCTVGQIKAGAPPKSFAIFFEAPAKNANTAADFVHFRGRTITAEGADSGNSQNDSVDFWPLADNKNFSVNPPVLVPAETCSGSWFDQPTEHRCMEVGLGTANPDRVKSAVPKTGGTFYTGEGVARAYPGGDSWVTQVKIPAGPTYTSAEVNETVVAGGAVSNLLTTNTTILDIPGTFSRLEISLIRDASTIIKGAKVNTAKIYYSDPTFPNPKIAMYPYEVLPCTDTTWGTLPQPGIPCVKSRTEFTKKTAPSEEWIGDWLLLIWAVDNGRYVN